MEERTLYQQIALRTDGSVYLGLVGPVRTGKSTFIKRFMEQLVLPNLENPYQRERARDELPQSGSGRTIMTSEPKFVPEEAVEISPDGKAKLSVRLIDSVGYLVPSASGAQEDGHERMVTTPWFETEIPLSQAAELGTKKVMEEHCSVGIVMTTDGSITDIPRSDYPEAEERAIRDMLATGKPFVVLVNSQEPDGEAAQQLCAQLHEKYSVSCMAISCLTMRLQEIMEVFRLLMMEFPVTEMQVFLPPWVQALPMEHPLKASLYEALRRSAMRVTRLSEAEPSLSELMQMQEVERFSVRQIDLGTGTVTCEVGLPQALFYGILLEQSGIELHDDGELMHLLGELANAKREYDRVAEALQSVRATGYGVVMPDAQELQLEQPQIVRKNGNYAVRLRASAPSIHMLRADIQTEISPMVGGEQESEQMLRSLLGEFEDHTDQIWDSNLFGKSLYTLVSEGLHSKIARMPEDARMKLRQTLTRMINENTGGMICILL